MCFAKTRTVPPPLTIQLLVCAWVFHISSAALLNALHQIARPQQHQWTLKNVAESLRQRAKMAVPSVACDGIDAVAEFMVSLVTARSKMAGPCKFGQNSQWQR
jgi:hypothetical protein